MNGKVSGQFDLQNTKNMKECLSFSS